MGAESVFNEAGKHGGADNGIDPDKQAPSSTETMREALDLLEAVSRQFSVRGAPREDGSLSPILRLDGLRTMLRLRFDPGTGNADAQRALDYAGERTLWFYWDLVDRAVKELGLSEADLNRMYVELDRAAL